MKYETLNKEYLEVYRNYTKLKNTDFVKTIEDLRSQLSKCKIETLQAKINFYEKEISNLKIKISEMNGVSIIYARSLKKKNP